MTTAWAPVTGDLMTRWAAEVDPAAPLPEHPRPQLVRPEWRTLNGLWDYVVQDGSLGRPVFDPDRRILVPFAIESALSGVKHPLRPEDRLWYRRLVEVPREWAGRRVLLHFGAVDFEAEVYLDGVLVGRHEGGYLPFTFDVTERLGAGAAELVVAVRDGTDRECGKQSLTPQGIVYTACSGIWQTVWLEAVPERRIRDLDIGTSAAESAITVGVDVGDHAADEGLEFEVVVGADGREVARVAAPVSATATAVIPDARLWSPDDPFLYDLTVRLRTPDGVLDEVASYAGIRTVSVERTPDGRRRFFLNGAPRFHHGVLDQGYWPDGVYTAPTDEALAFDIEAVKDLGYTMIRKHVKVEPARWYHHCDRLGVLVWQDMPGGGSSVEPRRRALTRLLGVVVGLLRFLDRDPWGPVSGWVFRNVTWRLFPESADGGRTAEQRAAFETQLHDMVRTLRNSPSIVAWVPFNESWGQYDAARIAREVTEQDPTRLVDHASGWDDRFVGDIVSCHDYAPKPGLPPRGRIRDRVIALTEYGGPCHIVPGHSWRAEAPPIYRAYETREQLEAVHESLLVQLAALARRGLSAAVYTQVTDVELEMNGLLTYDRAVVKVDPDRTRQLGRALTG